MLVNTGQDVFGSGQRIPFGNVKTLLSVNYNGPSFMELDWDGGIGLPAQSPDSHTTWLLLQLVNNGLVNTNKVCMGFYMNPVTKAGSVTFGDWDKARVDEMSKLVMPFKSFNLYNGALNYLWGTGLKGWTINGQQVSKDSFFVFDTGASDFKGDTTATDAATAAIMKYYQKNGSYPLMQLRMGTDIYGNDGVVNLTAQQDIQQVEAGPGKGTQVIAIDTLNIDGMILAGSVVLEDLYTVFWYKATGNPGNYVLTPTEVWLFNKNDGLAVIEKSSGKK